jgi:hypothetical protein
MGATAPECARLRAQAPGAGGGGAGALAGGFGGGRAAGIAGLLGSAISAARSQPAASTPAPVTAVEPAAIQQAIALCVQNAGGNTGAIQACLSIANAATPPAATRDPFAIPPPSQVPGRP